MGGNSFPGAMVISHDNLN